MKRCLYFLLPNRTSAETVAHELEQSGVPAVAIHLLEHPEHRGHKNIPLRDPEHWLERLLWNTNLGVFFVALALLVVSAISSSGILALVMLAVMIVTFILGLLATFLPDAHVDDFSEALRHGETLLAVDVPRSRVTEVENLVHRHHPEASVGGVGWTLGRAHPQA